MELSTRCQSLAARSSGVTVVRRGGDLFDSVFQRHYQGTGISRFAHGRDVAEGLVAYAKQLAGVCTEAPRETIHDGTPLGAIAAGLGAVAAIAFPAVAAAGLLWAFGGAMAAGAAAASGKFIVMSRSEVASMTPEMERQVKAKIVDKYNLEHSMSGLVTLYTSETKLDGEPFYRQLNGELSSDSSNLRLLMPLIKNLNFFINETRHAGGTVYSGVKLHADCLPLLGRHGALVRLPRFLSTSDSREEAEKHAADLPSLGAVGTLFIISIPPGFHGARDIRVVSEYDEAETLFPPWSQFCVTRPLEYRTVHLEAIDKYA